MRKGTFNREGLSMKALNIITPLVLIAVAAGCKTHEGPSVSSRRTVSPQMTQISAQATSTSTAQQAAADGAPQQIVTDKAVYTIKVIPNPRLSATSREGDKANAEVYSSNIIAVYVHPRNGATVNSTNSSAVPSHGK